MRSLAGNADAGQDKIASMTCCQQVLDISLASVPSADTFAVLAQAVLKHLLYMRQQIPAPFYDLAEVQTCIASITGFLVLYSIWS